MNELETIKQKAASLIARSGDDTDELRRGVELLKTAEEIENLQREAAGKRILGYVRELAPWAAVFATLFGLFYQAKQNHDERADAKWEQAFSAVASGTAGPADVIEFNKYINSREHREDARFAARQLLGSGPQDLEVFERVFNTLYTDARSEYFKDWLDIDRSLVATYNSVPQKQPIINLELKWITTKIAPAIKLRSGTEMDLSLVTLYDGDLAGVDLSRANLWAFEPERMNVRDAILNVAGSSYIPSKWNHTSWWQAKSISRNFLEGLERDASFDDPQYGYGDGISTNIGEYCANVSAWNVPDGTKCRGSVPK